MVGRQFYLNKKKPPLISSYVRKADQMSRLPVGSPCTRVIYSYARLREIMAEDNLSWVDVRVICGLTTTAVAALSKDRPLSLDTLLRVCYYLDLLFDDVVEITFADSRVTEADIDSATHFRKTFEPDASPEEEELLTDRLGAPVRLSNAKAIVAEQKHQEAQKGGLPWEGDTSTAKKEKRPESGRTESEKAEPDGKPGILFGDD